MVTINGKEVSGHSGSSILEYLTKSGYDPKKVAVECDGGVIPRKDYADKVIRDGEIIEIVSFVGGG
ncbi:MAG: sulfur carrier protein ThiS [Anaerovoracaceae bacterium]|jgi:sulfur carrier protein